MYFDNHPPINFSNAELKAHAHRDGGHYTGAGYHDYDVYQGTQWHLVKTYSNGRDFGCGARHDANHLGAHDTRESLIEAILHLTRTDQIPSWAANRLLEDLKYAGTQS